MSKPRRSTAPKQGKPKRLTTRPPKKMISGPAPKLRPSLTNVLQHTPVLDRLAESVGGAYCITFGGQEICTSRSFRDVSGQVGKTTVKFDECEAEVQLVVPTNRGKQTIPPGISKLALVGEVSVGLAHDFRNLLSIISMNLSRIADRETQKDDADELASEIQAAMHSALKLSERTEKLRNGRTGVFPADLKEIVGQAILFAERIAVHKGKEISIENDSGENLTVSVVENDVQHAILNVLINAIEHGIGKKGMIRITSCETDSCVYLAISNDGVPVPEPIRGKLLKEPLSECCVNGTGLYTSAKNLRSFGAEMSFTSDDDATTFMIKLPK